MMLASCGKQVKIHEWPGGFPVGGVSSISGVTFNTLSWSYLGNKLLAVPTGHCPVLLQAYDNEEIVDDLFWADTLKGLSCGVESGIFPNKSEKYVTVGLASGELITYDILGEDPSRNHTTIPEPVHFLDYSHSDTLLAAGCKNGQIYFYESTGIMNTSLQVPYSNSLSVMMFHPHSDSYIIGGSKEGVLAAWDLNTAIVKFQNQNHQDTISGICVAAHEEELISVSLDRTVLFYDLRTHVIVNTFRFGVELTAVAYFVDNEDVLIGTCKGAVMCFDRRKPTSLKYCFESQKNSPVKCISFNSRSYPEPKCIEEPNCVSTAKEEIPQSIASITKLDDHVKSDEVDSVPIDDEGSEASFYQVVDENSLSSLRQEIANTKEAVQKFMHDITDQFLKVRTEVSRGFRHLEQTQNQKWKEFHYKLSRLTVQDGRVQTKPNPKISEGSEPQRIVPPRHEGRKGTNLEGKNRN